MAKATKKSDPLDEVEDSAADDILSAVESGDKESLKSALSDFVRACMKREAKEEYSETDEEG